MATIEYQLKNGVLQLWLGGQELNRIESYCLHDDWIKVKLLAGDTQIECTLTFHPDKENPGEWLLDSADLDLPHGDDYQPSAELLNLLTDGVSLADLVKNQEQPTPQQ